jgi:aryl-alcohol dehydrogenase-like predicted oxidoreductase
LPIFANSKRLKELKSSTGISMQYRFLGRTGVQVSQLCFGTMSFGGDADEATSAVLFKRCRDAGINFFDTANVYSSGRSEEILGKLISYCREEIILTSKAHFPTGSDINARGSSRRHIMLAVN